MEDRLKILAQWLKDVRPEDFGYDMYTSGILEQKITYAQIGVCEKIGEYLEEILAMDSEQIDNELK